MSSAAPISEFAIGLASFLFTNWPVWAIIGGILGFLRGRFIGAVILAAFGVFIVGLLIPLLIVFLGFIGDILLMVLMAPFNP